MVLIQIISNQSHFCKISLLLNRNLFTLYNIRQLSETPRNMLGQERHGVFAITTLEGRVFFQSVLQLLVKQMDISKRLGTKIAFHVKFSNLGCRIFTC